MQGSVTYKIVQKKVLLKFFGHKWPALLLKKNTRTLNCLAKVFSAGPILPSGRGKCDKT